MTDLSNFSIRQFPPNNYSGVTIHINNPSVNAMPNTSPIGATRKDDETLIKTHNT